MTATKLRPYCSVCRSYYRGTYNVHASTERHKRNAYRMHHGGVAGHHGDVKAALGIRRLNVRQMLAGDSGSDHEKIRAHRRRLPDDGPRKVVKVGRYWRRRAWHATRY